MASTRVITDEELLQLPKDGNKYEVVDGELRMSPAGWPHEQIVIRLAGRLLAFVEANGLGAVLGSNAMYALAGGNKRCPDVSFILAGRLPPPGSGAGILDIAPDLAVEVLSPSDRPSEILRKVGEYQEAGVRLVWVIDPEKRRAVVYGAHVREVTETGVLEGEDVLPGFSCPLADILG